MSDATQRRMADGKASVRDRTVWTLEYAGVRLRCLRVGDGTFEVQGGMPGTRGTKWVKITDGTDAKCLLHNTVEMFTHRWSHG